jgi:pimeloyl-ACP methyl ester carboxylesterase
MAHGFGATRHYGLDPYARRFCESGHDVLLFDYRHFGESEGRPRGVIKVKRQHADWHAAIGHARSLGYERIVLWGSSFAGGHVLHIAAEQTDLQAVVSQVPHISGVATMLAVPVRHLPLAIGAILLDAVLSLIGRRHYVAAFAPEGRFAAIATPGAYDALIRMLPKDRTGNASPKWRAYFDRNNRIAATGLVEALFYSPGGRAARITCPVLLQAGRRDRTTPFKAACKAAARIPDCEFRAHDVDHFDVYLGEEFDAVVREQVDFLRRRVGPGASAPSANVEDLR